MTPDELRDRLDEASKAVLALVDDRGPRVPVQLEGLQGRVRELRRRILVRAAVRGFLDRETLEAWDAIDQIARVVELISGLQRLVPAGGRAEQRSAVERALRRAVTADVAREAEQIEDAT